jgi:hypothetical protein
MNIFQDSTTKLPKSDAQIRKIDFSQSDVAGRKDHIPTPLPTGGSTAIRHVPNEGSRS